jgi:hypothetical protein
VRVTDAQLLADFERLKDQHASKGATYSAIATRYHLSKDSVRGRVSRARKRIPAPPPPSPEPPRFVVLPKVAAAPKTDTERWASRLADLAASERFLRVSHLADIHFPDHDDDALNLAYRLVARKQPHVIVVGSDSADFALISHFKPDPDTNEDIADELDELRRHWEPHIATLRQVAPKAALVFINGNHEQRIQSHMAEHAPKLRRTIARDWQELITQRGQVHYLGDVDHVDVGPLHIQHGNRVNEHVSKSMLEDLSYQVSTMAGHVHRLTRYDRVGYRYPVSAITSGCLCHLLPKYAKGGKLARKWAQGTAFATVDMRGTFVAFDNVAFQRVGAELVAVSDGEVVVQPVAHLAAA